jgi:glyoxylase-like metal-dependent hydrolase (beta-lactamase superfamily II)
MVGWPRVAQDRLPAGPDDSGGRRGWLPVVRCRFSSGLGGLFPDASLLLLRGRQPALVDSGFTGHAEETAAWVRAHTGHVALVVNTHWHSDHVEGNALLQATGAGIAASAPDAQTIARRDPGRCLAAYLNQPVRPLHRRRAARRRAGPPARRHRLGDRRGTAGERASQPAPSRDAAASGRGSRPGAAC